MFKKLFNNTGKVTTFILKRERVYIAVWLVILIGITLAVAVAYTHLYSTPEEIIAAAEMMQNPAVSAMMGDILSDVYTVRDSICARDAAFFDDCSSYNEYIFSN